MQPDQGILSGTQTGPDHLIHQQPVLPGVVADLTDALLKAGAI